jgi:hypothetical protein
MIGTACTLALCSLSMLTLRPGELAAAATGAKAGGGERRVSSGGVLYEKVDVTDDL